MIPKYEKLTKTLNDMFIIFIIDKFFVNLKNYNNLFKEYNLNYLRYLIEKYK